MNIISYNVRGLGRRVKWVAIRRMVRKEKINMLCIQETKKETIDVGLCQALWGDKEVTWEWQAAVNSAGGLLCLWSEEVFKLQNKVIGSGFILLVGQWLKEEKEEENGSFTLLGIFVACNTRPSRKNLKMIQRLTNPG